ncbi:MAG: DUF4198 domain-containing protein [Pseudomonadota bacterium]|nr:DUF4198 domain-containing protein [Pseudomonadota bacterium]
MPLFIFIILLLSSFSVCAHFQVLLPNTDMVTTEMDHRLQLTLMFTHPMQQGPLMDMKPPVQFGVLVDGTQHDLRAQLKAQQQKGNTFFTSHYRLKKPADYVFFVEPQPYWEATEGRLIIHYTKVIVDAFGAESGWDAEVGFPVEIEPLVRPYGLWQGNVFRGIVKRAGQPVAFATVEVEYWNEDKQITIGADPLITQVIKTDAQGSFTYAMPQAGWWGFAALVEADKPMLNPQGKAVPVELGAVIWVKTYPIK